MDHYLAAVRAPVELDLRLNTVPGEGNDIVDITGGDAGDGGLEVNQYCAHGANIFIQRGSANNGADTGCDHWRGARHDVERRQQAVKVCLSTLADHDVAIDLPHLAFEHPVATQRGGAGWIG